MNKLIWIFQILICLFFVMPGIIKVSTPKEGLIAKNMLEPGASEIPVRAIGVFELLGCIGIILPAWKNIAPGLTPLSALGFCIVTAAASLLHYSRGEYKMLTILIPVFTISAMVAWYRFFTKIR
ncbi:DoxX family protein [Mucilaginibacter psychrotolerans]|uniref:DoxX family protein n=1 Tax=Mucilaginibacter psychrotolerans TaxID=1524096 RepID=A0A4Y8SA18_9SPHI|nr:DoxX family protein [Mucilaginibacter psychrotolerans]TFF35485.1 DoxX family protein [Mucilaginibacter psychrotolerans]